MTRPERIFEAALRLQPENVLAQRHLEMVFRRFDEEGERIQAQTAGLLPAPDRDSMAGPAPLDGFATDSLAGISHDSLLRALQACVQLHEIGDPVVARKRAQLLADFGDFLTAARELLTQFCEPALRKTCALKVDYAENALKKGSFPEVVSPVWSLYHNVTGHGGIRRGEVGKLRCLTDIGAAELAAQQLALEKLGLDAARYHLSQGDAQLNAGEWDAARKHYDRTVQLCSYFESSIDPDDLYDPGEDPANVADRLKSAAFVRMAISFLQQNNRADFCKLMRWAQYPGTTPYAARPSWLLQHRLKNVNRVKVKRAEILRGLDCCGRF